MAVVDIVVSDFPAAFATGFVAGFLVAALIAGVRAVVKIFRFITEGRNRSD